MLGGGRTGQRRGLPSIDRSLPPLLLLFSSSCSTPRPMHAANLVLEAKRWLQKEMPWWDRRGGRDHIWLMAHDEGEREMGGGAGPVGTTSGSWQ